MARILLVIDNLEFGGGERVFLQLAAGLRDRFEIFVTAMPGGIFELRLKKLGTRFIPVDMTRQIAWKPVSQIKNIMLRYEIDLVHSQGARADFFCRIAGRLARVPHSLCTIAMPAEGFEVGALRKKIYLLLDRFSGRYVDRFIVVSDSLKKTLTRGRRIPAQRVVRIYNGVEVGKYQPDLKETYLRDHLGIPPTVPLIGCIGRMVWQKGFQYVIEAVPSILRAVPEARFLVIGEGPLRSDLERLSQELNLENKVIFPGFYKDIQHLLSNLDILVIPSLLEGFPMITLEAMAMAKPIVATRIQGITEQISNGKEGILVSPKNPEALVVAILRLLQDGELASRLGLAARNRVESHFTIEKMVRETEKVYLSLLEAI